VARQSSESFDEHERPTAQRSCVDKGDDDRDGDPNATTRIKPFELEQALNKGSGTRPIITAEQIDRYMSERTLDFDLEGPPDERAATPSREKTEKTEGDVDIRDRETVDALTLQRETLIITPAANAQSTAQQIPIDVDLSRLMLPTPRPAAGRPVPFTARLAARLDHRQLTIAAGFLIAMVSALLGFIAGRL
jgi:hypothetical protein